MRKANSIVPKQSQNQSRTGSVELNWNYILVQCCVMSVLPELWSCHSRTAPEWWFWSSSLLIPGVITLSCVLLLYIICILKWEHGCSVIVPCPLSCPANKPTTWPTISNEYKFKTMVLYLMPNFYLYLCSWVLCTSSILLLFSNEQELSFISHPIKRELHPRGISVVGTGCCAWYCFVKYLWKSLQYSGTYSRNGCER